MCIAKMEIIAVTLTSTLSRLGRLLPDCVLLRVKDGGAAEVAPCWAPTPLRLMAPRG